MTKNSAEFFSKIASKLKEDINVMMIAEIESYDVSTNTAKIIPQHITPNTGEQFSPLIDIPIGFFSMGGFTIKVQPRKGDLVLAIFCDYDTENVLLDGTIEQKTDRTHSLEDAVILPLSINLFNQSNNATQNFTIAKEGTNTYIKILQNGDIVLNAPHIYAGEGATTPVQLAGGGSSSTLYAK